jgi:hypothetical protein
MPFPDSHQTRSTIRSGAARNSVESSAPRLTHSTLRQIPNAVSKPATSERSDIILTEEIVPFSHADF